MPGAVTPVLLLLEADHIAQKGSEPLGSTDLPSVRQASRNKCIQGFLGLLGLSISLLKTRSQHLCFH